MAPGIDAIRAAIEDSRLVSAVRTAVRSPWNAAVLRRTLEGSTLVAGTSHLARTVPRWILASAIASTAPWIRDRAGLVLDGALVGGLVEDAVDAVESSWVYGWTGDGPDSGVVVIDLRDTISVGPVQTARDELLEYLLPASTYSLLVRTCHRLLDEVLDAPVRVSSFAVLVAVLGGATLGAALGVVDANGYLLAVAFAVLAAVGTRIRVDYTDLAGSRSVRRLGRLLEPPELQETVRGERNREDSDPIDDGHPGDR